MSVNQLLQLKGHVEKSFLHKSVNYEVNISIKDMFNENGSFLLYNTFASNAYQNGLRDPNGILELMTPAFQRSNTKWSVAMQRRFVENVLCGAKSTIHLFEITDKNSIYSLCNCGVLDGLQRTTALADFQVGKFEIFDGITWKGLMASSGVFPRCRLTVSIYQFSTIREVVKFYIDMNKGITHSPEDLESAYKYLESLDGNESV